MRDLFLFAKHLFVAATRHIVFARPYFATAAQDQDCRRHPRRSEDPSPIHARMRASLAGLDEGTFTEGHELDRKWKIAKEMTGRRLTQAEAKRLLTKFSPARKGARRRGPPIIFGTPRVGPPTVLVRSTSAFEVSIYHHKANVSGLAEFRGSPAPATTKAPLPRGAIEEPLKEVFYANGGIHNPLPTQTRKHRFRSLRI